MSANIEDFDMDADDDDQSVEQENVRTKEKKSAVATGIAMDALHGLLESYSTTEIKAKNPSRPIPLQLNQSISTVSTPVRSTVVPQAKTPSVNAFNARTNSAEVLLEHCGAKTKEKSAETSIPNGNFLLQSTIQPFKSMYQTFHKRAMALNEQIEQIEDLFLNLNEGKTNFHLHPIGDAGQDEVSLVGRIVCDSAGQLNAQSILLEGSQRTSKCARIRLDLSSLPSYSFFPGQIVLVNGTYTNPSLFHVKELIDPPLPPAPASTKISHDVNFLVASGPFLLAQGDITAFQELLRRADDDRTVQTLILLGPFVDERSSYVQNLQDRTYEELFHEMIHLIKSCRVKIVLIPSLRDIHHDSIYPLIPLKIDDNRDGKILCSSEPSQLVVDGLQCAISSTDILCHLSSEEISSNHPVDRMSRLVRHLFQQRSFYPLVPPHESVSIEYEKALEHARFDTLPHLFITSSDLRPFIKFIDRVCAINIGRLVKNQDSTALNTASGTYAKISMRQNNEENLSDYLHVQILRL